MMRRLLTTAPGSPIATAAVFYDPATNESTLGLITHTNPTEPIGTENVCDDYRRTSPTFGPSNAWTESFASWDDVP